MAPSCFVGLTLKIAVEVNFSLQRQKPRKQNKNMNKPSEHESSLLTLSRSAFPWTYLLYNFILKAQLKSGCRTVFLSRRLALANQFDTYNSIIFQLTKHRKLSIIRLLSHAITFSIFNHWIFPGHNSIGHHSILSFIHSFIWQTCWALTKEIEHLLYSGNENK